MGIDHFNYVLYLVNGCYFYFGELLRQIRLQKVNSVNGGALQKRIAPMSISAGSKVYKATLTSSPWLWPLVDIYIYIETRQLQSSNPPIEYFTI